MLLLQGTEPALDKGIVRCPALAIHADTNLHAGQRIHPVFTGILAALVGIDNLRFSVARYRVLKQLGLVFLLQGIGNLPTDNKPAVEIDYGREVHMPFAHRNVGDVDGPDLVGSDNLQIPEQVGTHIFGLTPPAQVLLRINRLDTHLAQ